MTPLNTSFKPEIMNQRRQLGGGGSGSSDRNWVVAVDRPTSGHLPFSIYIAPASRRSILMDRDASASSQLKKDISASMPAFKNPGFQDRQAAATRARSAALAAYKARPPIDEAVVAERKARDEARKHAVAAKREAMRRSKEEAAEAKREQERQALAAAEAASKAKADAAAQAKADATARKKEERLLWTEADRKAARDARYAARKARQGRW